MSLKYLILVMLLPLMLIQCSEQDKKKDEIFVRAAELIDDSGHTDIINALAAGSKKRFLASGGEDSLLIIWYLPEQKAYRIKHLNSGINKLRLNKSSTLLFAGTANGEVVVFEFPTLNEVHRWQAHEIAIAGLAILESGDILTADKSGILCTWNNDFTLQDKFSADFENPHLIAIDPLKNLTAYAADHVIHFNSPDGYEIFPQLIHSRKSSRNNWYDNTIGAMQFIYGDSIMVTAAGRDIYFWNYQTKTIIKRVQAHLAQIRCFALSEDGKTLASGSADKSIAVVDRLNYKIKQMLYGHFHTISALEFSNNNDTLFSASVDQSINIWDLKKGASIGILGNPVHDPEKMWRMSDVKAWRSGTFSVGAETYRPMKKGDAALKISLKIRNVSKSDLYFYSSNLWIKDKDGRIIRPSAREGHVVLEENEYLKHRLNPNETFNGTFVFLVDRKQNNFSLTYEGLDPIRINL